MRIEKIAILGAGAVGASLAHQLITQAGGVAPTIIADKARGEKYRRDGFTVNSEVIRPPVARRGNFDLVILATKSYHLDSALPLLDACVGENTALLSLMNGISSESILGIRYGHHRVVPAMILGIDAIREADGIRYLNRGTIFFGVNPEAPEQSPLVAEVDAWFDRVGLGHELSPDITRTLWRKFMINVGANQVSALHGAPYGRLRNEKNLRELMRQAMGEVVALSRLERTGLIEKDIDDWFEVLSGLDPTGKTSMLQDVEAQRRTEVDLFAGTVIDLSERHGLDAPVNRRLRDEIGRLEVLSHQEISG